MSNYPKKAAFFKENEREVKHMCKLMEDAMKQERQKTDEQGIEQGVLKKRPNPRPKLPKKPNAAPCA